MCRQNVKQHVRADIDFSTAISTRNQPKTDSFRRCDDLSGNRSFYRHTVSTTNTLAVARLGLSRRPPVPREATIRPAFGTPPPLQQTSLTSEVLTSRDERLSCLAPGRRTAYSQGPCQSLTLCASATSNAASNC